MARIPGIVYLLVGLVMMGYSKIIEARNPEANITLFFWVGLALFFIGVFKSLVQFVVAKSTKKVGERERAELDQARGAAHETIHKSVEQQGRATHLVCSECGAKLHVKSRYCNWCGAPAR